MTEQTTIPKSGSPISDATVINGIKSLGLAAEVALLDQDETLRVQTLVTQLTGIRLQPEPNNSFTLPADATSFTEKDIPVIGRFAQSSFNDALASNSDEAGLEKYKAALEARYARAVLVLGLSSDRTEPKLTGHVDAYNQRLGHLRDPLAGLNRDISRLMDRRTNAQHQVAHLGQAKAATIVADLDKKIDRLTSIAAYYREKHGVAFKSTFPESTEQK